MSEKIDFKNQLKHLYNPPKKEPVILEIPPMNFLMIDGKGDPNTAKEYKDAVSSLFPLAYGLKFAIKKFQGIDYGVLPLEGLWWAEDMREFSVHKKDEWLWTMMIMQPEYVTVELVEEIRIEVKKKKYPPLIDNIRFEAYDEGLCVQLMHIGPYADEAPNIARMHEYAVGQGNELAGKHHEIYLKDPTRTAPERLMTVLRQPIRKA
jgi:hypothetical protein